MSLSTPTQITIPFADTGTRTAIPQAANNTTGRAGYDLGFPPINLTPKVAGGIPPFGQDMNGILYDITVAEQFVQAGGSWPYDSAFATAIGGYPLGALVQRSDSSGFWRNTVANNTTDPDAGGAGWTPEESGLTSVAMSSSNVTLTSLQAAKNIIVITGTLTANLQLIFPGYAKTWVVVNSASGAFTVTCKTASGSGVAIATSVTATVYGNGTTGIFNANNIVQATETVPGIAEISTQAETNALADDTRFVTPLKLGFGFAFSFGTNGYVKFPSWLGGFIVQWGVTANIPANTSSVITLPLTYPTNILFAITGWHRNSTPGAGANNQISGEALSLSTIRVYNSTTGSAEAASWISFGR